MNRDDHAEWNAVLGHELRSPIAAILGYYELVEDGTFGELPPAALDSIRRIGFAARQLLMLVEAVEQTGRDGLDEDEVAGIDVAEICRDAIRSVAFDAESRSTRLELAPGGGTVRTRRTAACRALALVLGAAIKVSPGSTIVVVPTGAGVSIRGSRLEAVRDSGAPDVPLSGAALRLHLARATGRPAGLDIRLDNDGIVWLHFPIDGSEHSP